MPFGKIKIYIIIAIIFGSFLAVGYIFAQGYGLEEAGKTSGLAANQISKAGDIPAMLGVLVSIALSLVGVYFFILILYGGFVWMTAAGSTEKVETAKKKMTSAVIGLVIVLSAYTLTRFIFDTLLQESKATLSCATTPAGVRAAECGQNEVCPKKGEKCTSECEYSYGAVQGKCIDITSAAIDITSAACEGRLFSMCPGANMKCCVPFTGLAQLEEKQKAQPSGGTAPAAPEHNACEQQSNFCVDKSTCEGGTYNGKSLGQNGCPTGDICCKNCSNIHGVCIDTTEYECDDPISFEPDSKRLKTGYCFGVYDAKNIQCCTGMATRKKPLL